MSTNETQKDPTNKTQTDTTDKPQTNPKPPADPTDKTQTDLTKEKDVQLKSIAFWIAIGFSVVLCIIFFIVLFIKVQRSKLKKYLEQKDESMNQVTNEGTSIYFFS